eukprot:CAMPEP_0181261844 /NCGR_PEP_ID=MMETSP1097-20121128/1715_1 /TAXON_ID=35684 /ORGANISM="Pseudopedinella elastica, Strain CCMP716" /LENGTH=179 /DNA_ID=CAMNT_0023360495 /DNA_START=153 /DNA_END=692 /DNA_ORIENTATION=-
MSSSKRQKSTPGTPSGAPSSFKKSVHCDGSAAVGALKTLGRRAGASTEPTSSSNPLRSAAAWAISSLSTMFMSIWSAVGDCLAGVGAAWVISPSQASSSATSPALGPLAIFSRALPLALARVFRVSRITAAVSAMSSGRSPNWLSSTAPSRRDTSVVSGTTSATGVQELEEHALGLCAR